MAINEDHLQVEVAGELEVLAQTLAHATRTAPVPADSYGLLAELSAATSSIEQVCRQLSAWHTTVIAGQHYEGEDDRGDGATGTVAAAHALDHAAEPLVQAHESLTRAHAANGRVRWY